MKNTILTKDKLIQWLTDNKNSIENIGKNKISMLLNDNNILDMTNSQAANKLIDYFQIENNYFKIFK